MIIRGAEVEELPEEAGAFQFGHQFPIDGPLIGLKGIPPVLERFL
jgi:hypothetical protein